MTRTLRGASFVGSDATTQGNWIGAYGASGYSIASSPPSLPADTRLTLTDAVPYTWASSTADSRALWTPGGATRAATTWYGTVCSLDVDLGAGTRRVALYFLDWDVRGRGESVEVRDSTTGALLDTRPAANFGNGQYLVWTVTGHVTFRVIGTAGPNTVVSGIFFDAAGTSSNAAPTVTMTAPANGATAKCNCTSPSPPSWPSSALWASRACARKFPPRRQHPLSPNPHQMPALISIPFHSQCPTPILPQAR